ncbi:MAG: photoactive yellow protein [Polaromonas sp.]|nr:photoactive yellow protein [Polaromonas sp.]
MSSELFEKYQQFFKVDGRDVVDTLDKLPQDAFDDLPMGAILLNNKARIVKYNRTEGELTNRDPKQVIGASFFLSLAVCGVSEQFQGRFKGALKAMAYDQMFPYVFCHEMPETPMMVRITKPRIPMASPHVWILVRRVMPPVPQY